MDTQTPQHEKQEKSFTKKLFFAFLIVFGVFLILPLLLVALFFLYTQWQNLPYKAECASTSEKISDEHIAFLLTDETGTPLTCKNVRISEEIDVCIESPCPDFRVVKRIKSSKEGKIVVRKDLFTKKITDYFEAKPKVVLRDHKQYLFHAQGNYNTHMTVQDIFTSSTQNQIITLNLKKKNNQECTSNQVRKNTRKNYCD